MTVRSVIAEFNTPIGCVILGSIDNRLCLFDWVDGRKRNIVGKIEARVKCDFIRGYSPVFYDTLEFLNEYLVGKRTEFDVPLHLIGTEFQKKVWEELTTLGYSETITYAALASRVGSEKAVRAVANAVAMNPISILIPCHRIVPSAGIDYGNYAGGRELKKYLIELEKKHNK